jgi:hypothetical protein
MNTMKFQLQLMTFYVATTYGSGTYGTNTFNGTLQIGPITLPDTGAALALAGVIMLAVSGGLVAWVLQQRRRRRAL